MEIIEAEEKPEEQDKYTNVFNEKLQKYIGKISQIKYPKE